MNFHIDFNIITIRTQVKMARSIPESSQNVGMDLTVNSKWRDRFDSQVKMAAWYTDSRRNPIAQITSTASKAAAMSTRVIWCCASRRTWLRKRLHAALRCVHANSMLGITIFTKCFRRVGHFVIGKNPLNSRQRYYTPCEQIPVMQP